MLCQSKPDFLKLLAVNDFLKPDDDANEQVWIEPQPKKKKNQDGFIPTELQKQRQRCYTWETKPPTRMRNQRTDAKKKLTNSRCRKNRRHSYGTDHISISYR
jgi:predicted amidophosphoribosyltransferase